MEKYSVLLWLVGEDSNFYVHVEADSIKNAILAAERELPQEHEAEIPDYVVVLVTFGHNRDLKFYA